MKRLDKENKHRHNGNGTDNGTHGTDKGKGSRDGKGGIMV